MKKLLAVLAALVVFVLVSLVALRPQVQEGPIPVVNKTAAEIAMMKRIDQVRSMLTAPADAAITAAIANQWKYDTLATLATHTIKVALYNGATMNGSCTAYTATNEASGAGYTAGGAVLSGVTATLYTNTAVLDANDVTWSSSTFTADGAMLYDVSNSNHCIRVFPFTSTSSNNSTFTLTMPAPSANSGLFRLP